MRIFVQIIGKVMSHKVKGTVLFIIPIFLLAAFSI